MVRLRPRTRIWYDSFQTTHYSNTCAARLRSWQVCPSVRVGHTGVRSHFLPEECRHRLGWPAPIAIPHAVARASPQPRCLISPEARSPVRFGHSWARGRGWQDEDNRFRSGFTAHPPRSPKANSQISRMGLGYSHPALSAQGTTGYRSGHQARSSSRGRSSSGRS